MRKTMSKEIVIQNKKKSIRELNDLLEKYINSDDEKLLKKADLLSYWLQQYAQYVGFEEQFTPTKLMRYTRGNVLRVNFGFNVGKEFGGLHYAVVLDNDNKRNADVITVVPLSSTNGREVHENNVDLGAELYGKVSSRHDQMFNHIQEELDDTAKALVIMNSMIDSIRKEYPEDYDSTEVIDKYRNVFEFTNELNQKNITLKKELGILCRHGDEISRLKSGTMAVTNQITTISKQRIYIPKRSTDFLYNISLSTRSMDKIEEKLKDLFFYGN